MATTSLKDVSLGIRDVGSRTDFAGSGVTDLSAEEDRFANIFLSEGIVEPDDALQVVAGGAATMNVVVGSGASKTDHYLIEGIASGQGNYLVRLEAATETFALSAADPSNARKDEIYVIVQDDAYDASNRVLPVLAVREGTPSPGPGAPGPDGAWKAYALLSTVDVPAAAADILVCTFTDERVATELGLKAADSHLLDGSAPSAFAPVVHEHPGDIEMALYTTVSEFLLTGTLQTITSDTFMKPAGWGSYDLKAICSSMLRDSGGAGNAGISVQLSIDGNIRSIPQIEIKNLDDGFYVIQHFQAGITGDAVIEVKAIMTYGDNGKVTGSQTSIIAIRKS